MRPFLLEIRASQSGACRDAAVIYQLNLKAPPTRRGQNQRIKALETKANAPARPVWAEERRHWEHWEPGESARRSGSDLGSDAQSGPQSTADACQEASKSSFPTSLERNEAWEQS